MSQKEKNEEVDDGFKEKISRMDKEKLLKMKEDLENKLQRLKKLQVIHELKQDMKDAKRRKEYETERREEFGLSNN